MPRKMSPDYWLFLVVLALLGLGVVMVYSASAILATDRFRDAHFFLKKQLFWAVLGLARHVGRDGRRLSPVAPPGEPAPGARLRAPRPGPGAAVRAVHQRDAPVAPMGTVSVQPTELAKLVLVVYLADFLARRQAVIGNLWRGVVPPLVVTGGVAGLVLLQPDLGSAVAIVGVVLCMIFVAGARLQHLGLIGAPGRPGRRAGRLGGALPAAADPHVPGPLGRPAGSRVPDHPVLSRARRRRAPRARTRGVEAEALLPPRAPHRLHLRDPRRGARVRRRGARRSPSSGSSCGAASGSGSGSPTRSARSWRSGSRRSSSPRRWSTWAWSSGSSRRRGCRFRSCPPVGPSLLVAMAAVGLLLNVSQRAEV